LSGTIVVTVNNLLCIGEFSREAAVWLACSSVDNIMFGILGEEWRADAAHIALSYCWM
jgi:hypothetical protein